MKLYFVHTLSDLHPIEDEVGQTLLVCELPMVHVG